VHICTCAILAFQQTSDGCHHFNISTPVALIFEVRIVFAKKTPLPFFHKQMHGLQRQPNSEGDEDGVRLLHRRLVGMASEAYLEGEAWELVDKLCCHFYGLGWVTGTDDIIAVKVNEPTLLLIDRLIAMSPSSN
jgi:hypothetical protein